MSHHHKCSCGAPYECNAPIVRNDDGIPDRVCQALMDNMEGCCELCEEHGQCEECGQPNQPDKFLCAQHQAEADANAEPPEPDLNGVSAGEAMDRAYAVDRSQR